MYYPQEPKEQSGCLQTMIITRMILSILFVPVGLIAAAIFALLFTLYLFTISPPLALIPLGMGGLGIYLFARWEGARVAKENPPDS